MGKLEFLTISMPYGNGKKKLSIYLPNEYFTDPTHAYPVVYMQDGQNLFLDKSAYRGHSWKIKETLEHMEKDNKQGRFIVVGIDHAGSKRFDEYSPWKKRIEETMLGNGLLTAKKLGGQGEEYANFIVNAVKPLIDHKYRTKPDHKNTTIAGSSMGAFISAYMAAKYPDVFGNAGIFSLASWFAEDELLQYIRQSSGSTNQHYYIRVGTKESLAEGDDKISQTYVNNTLRYVRSLLEKGVAIGNIMLSIGINDTHSEWTWAKYIDEFFSFLENVRNC